MRGKIGLQSRWTLAIFQNYVGTRQRCGRDTDVKSCTHAHRENIRAHTIWVQIGRASCMSKVLPSLICTTSRLYSSSCRCSDHSELYCSVNSLMCSVLSCETNECLLGECPDTIYGAVFMSGGITCDGHISRPGITELELGPSENSYSRAR